MAIVLAPLVVTAPAPLGAQAQPLGSPGGCAICCVRHYCAVYAPTSAATPPDCPFGPGPAPRHN